MEKYTSEYSRFQLNVYLKLTRLKKKNNVNENGSE